MGAVGICVRLKLGWQTLTLRFRKQHKSVNENGLSAKQKSNILLPTLLNSLPITYLTLKYLHNLVILMIR